MEKQLLPKIKRCVFFATSASRGGVNKPITIPSQASGRREIIFSSKDSGWRTQVRSATNVAQSVSKTALTKRMLTSRETAIYVACFAGRQQTFLNPPAKVRCLVPFGSRFQQRSYPRISWRAVGPICYFCFGCVSGEIPG